MKNRLLLALFLFTGTCAYTQQTQENDSTTYQFPILVDTVVSAEKLEQLVERGSVYFIMHGIDSSIPNDYQKFKEKYGIGLFKENCTIDPITSERTTKNNKIISAYLDNKYGEQWQNELRSLPYGLY